MVRAGLGADGARAARKSRRNHTTASWANSMQCDCCDGKMQLLQSSAPIIPQRLPSCARIPFNKARLAGFAKATTTCLPNIAYCRVPVPVPEPAARCHHRLHNTIPPTHLSATLLFPPRFSTSAPRPPLSPLTSWSARTDHLPRHFRNPPVSRCFNPATRLHDHSHSHLTRFFEGLSRAHPSTNLT